MAAIAAGVLALAGSIAAAHAQQPSANPQYNWSGFYIGAHLGGALELTDVADPFGPSIYGDTIRSPGPIAGAQAGYNWQFGQALVGLEADASWADLYGTDTCFAFSGFYVSANCSSDIDAMGTITGRFGWLLGVDRAMLLYGKAGAAWQHSEVDATAGGGGGYPGTSAGGLQWGWTLGVGAERAISQRWSMRAEYDYVSFGSDGLATPPSAFQPVPSGDPLALTPVASTATDFSQDAHLFKLGLNYRLGEAQPSASDWSPTPPPSINGTTLEIGARYAYGWGRFQKDLGIPGMGLASPASRLTYGDNQTNGAEMFARLDTASGWMAKGFVGKGSGEGQLNDEDWGVPFAIFVPTRSRRPTITSATAPSTSAMMSGAMHTFASRRSSATASCINTCRASVARKSPTPIRTAAARSPSAYSPLPRMTPGRRCGWALPPISSSRRT
jgi:opacity protein-like surface antigen